jgi:hypothetical protein
LSGAETDAFGFAQAAAFAVPAARRAAIRQPKPKATPWAVFFSCCAIFRLKQSRIASKVRNLSNSIRLPAGSAAARLSVLHSLSFFHYFQF